MYSLLLKQLNRPYETNGKKWNDLYSGIDCSGLISGFQINMIRNINEKYNDKIFEPDICDLFNTHAAGIIENIIINTDYKKYITSTYQLKSNMLLGFYDICPFIKNGRYKNIHHIAQIIKNPINNILELWESTWNVRRYIGFINIQKRLNEYINRNKKIIAVNPTLLKNII